jgi:hypothetical protein
MPFLRREGWVRWNGEERERRKVTAITPALPSRVMAREQGECLRYRNDLAGCAGARIAGHDRWRLAGNVVLAWSHVALQHAGTSVVSLATISVAGYTLRLSHENVMLHCNITLA